MKGRRACHHTNYRSKQRDEISNNVPEGRLSRVEGGGAHCIISDTIDRARIPGRNVGFVPTYSQTISTTRRHKRFEKKQRIIIVWTMEGNVVGIVAQHSCTTKAQLRKSGNAAATNLAMPCEMKSFCSPLLISLWLVPPRRSASRQAHEWRQAACKAERSNPAAEQTQNTHERRWEGTFVQQEQCSLHHERSIP